MSAQFVQAHFYAIGERKSLGTNSNDLIQKGQISGQSDV